MNQFLFFSSILLVLAHTLEESNGHIWQFINDQVGIYCDEFLYASFQITALVIAVMGTRFGFERWTLLFLAAQMMDVLVMHCWWKAPGRYTAILMTLNALMVMVFLK